MALAGYALNLYHEEMWGIPRYSSGNKVHRFEWTYLRKMPKVSSKNVIIAREIFT